MSPALNYKEATGVRARTDLSANAKPDSGDGRLNDEQLVRCADWLMQQLKDAEDRRSTHVFIPVQHTRRLVDAILEVVNRGGTR